MKISELLSDETKWTKHVGARDEHGGPVPINSPNAVCWCLIGAVYKTGYGLATVDRIYAHVHGSVSEFNDRSTFEEVKAVLIALDL